MPNLNKVLLIGRLTRDPELRVMPKGTPVCQFGLAINRETKAESGEKQAETTFVDVEAWSKQAEAIAKYLTKGRHIYLEGRLKLDQWEDKTTREKRSRMKVVLESFQFLDSAGQGEPSKADSGPSDAAPVQRPAPRPQTAAARPGPDEDVPF